jgi:hypothetical protein
MSERPITDPEEFIAAATEYFERNASIVVVGSWALLVLAAAYVFALRAVNAAAWAWAIAWVTVPIVVLGLWLAHGLHSSARKMAIRTAHWCMNPTIREEYAAQLRKRAS